MNIKVLVTFAIIAVVLLAIPATLLAFNLFNIRSYLPFAEGEIEPMDVNITNITENGFSVTWWTPTKQTEGSIKYGTGGVVSTVVQDDRGSGNDKKFETHHVSVSSLTPETEYSFSVFVNNKEYKRGGASYYTVKTLPVLSLAPTPSPVTGTISNAEIIKNDAVVFVYLSNSDEDESVVYSTNTSNNGTFAIDVGTIRSSVVSRPFVIGNETQMNFYAIAKGKLYGTKETAFSSDAGNISLTETVVALDFPTLDYVTVDEEPSIDPVDISVTSPEEGEVLTSLSRVRGYANPEENLTIEITGTQTITADIVADSSGYYSYDIYETLTDGNYGLTVSSKDDQERLANTNFQILGEQVGDENQTVEDDYEEPENNNTSNNNNYYEDDNNSQNPLPSTGIEDYWGLILATIMLFMSAFYAVIIKKL